MTKRKDKHGVAWDAPRVRALRERLRLTQQRMADELGTRQQTVSEWETGLYRPRGASATLLGIIAERAGFQYEITGETEAPEDDAPTP